MLRPLCALVCATIKRRASEKKPAACRALERTRLQCSLCNLAFGKKPPCQAIAVKVGVDATTCIEHSTGHQCLTLRQPHSPHARDRQQPPQYIQPVMCLDMSYQRVLLDNRPVKATGRPGSQGKPGINVFSSTERIADCGRSPEQKKPRCYVWKHPKLTFEHEHLKTIRAA